MGILDTLLSLIGLDGSSSEDGRRETTVSVERDRVETESEAAVKGAAPDDEAAAAGTDAAASTDSLVDGDGAAAAAEPAEATGPDADDGETELETVEAESVGETTGEHEAVETAESVEVIKGIGPAYAERLAKVGVESVADLAAADAEELAAEVDLSEKRVGRWIDRATDR
ncbi:helix-hairpin-helix domain-containing protein [Haloplanus pelagicus]|jgi:predicted flap endonuclease-1-like 5' DNA nuclease|uniref:helix-hairpin-helix domain-containing protein n=1 Tax=Haloplanus pelagicus TaxID=2949995 RepID=UPI00203CC831|nr:helix-hairpin-helix domain-containing protein [Haloplanus sp. HW8-1]